MSKKATEYAVLIWDFKPEDFPSLGCPCREINVDTLPEAMVLYEKETDVFAKELHHYYEVDTKEWESSSNCLMEWDAYDGTSEWMDEYDEQGEPIVWLSRFIGVPIPWIEHDHHITNGVFVADAVEYDYDGSGEWVLVNYNETRWVTMDYVKKHNTPKYREQVGLKEEE
jgi:hypothetical protein